MPARATETAIRRICRDTLDDLYGVVSRRCDGDRDLAEDIVQDTWLRAVPAWRTGGIPDHPLAWLTTVASRLVASHHRRRPPLPLEGAPGEALAAPDADIAIDRFERRALVERALRSLPRLQRSLLEAFHYDRRPVAEIATELGLSERAVEGRLRRARQQLRRTVESDPSAPGGEP